MIEHRFLIGLEQLGPHRRTQVSFREHRRPLEPDDIPAF
jgi:hypothetical protein